jgi:hypothetical protein
MFHVEFQPNPHQPKLVNRLPSGCLVVRTACRLDRNTQPAGPYQVRVSSAGFRQQSLRGGFDEDWSRPNPALDKRLRQPVRHHPAYPRRRGAMSVSTTLPSTSLQPRTKGGCVAR